MKSLKEVSLGFLSAIASTVVIMGALLVAMTEGIALSIPTIEPTFTMPVVENTLLPGIPSPTKGIKPTQARPVIVTITATPPCPIPANWEEYIIQAGDKLSKLAEGRGISVQDLKTANCLKIDIDSLLAGTTLYLPPLPTPTSTITVTLTRTLRPTFTLFPTLTSCSPPSNWVRYVVQAGDTLFKLSNAVGISDWHVLMAANCLPNDNLATGQILYLPRLPARTPTLTSTPTRPPVITRTPTRTRTRTPTSTPVTPTVPSPTPTGTSVPTATATPTEVPSPTPTPTLAPQPSATPTATLEPPPPG